MKLILFLLVAFQSLFLAGQIVAEKKVHDFGDLYPNAQTYVDIKFTNNSDKKHYLLTIDKPRDVYYIFSSKALLPDSSITIRFKINDGLKGKFNHTVDVYFSDSGNPITISLIGNVKEPASNPLTECPDFNNNPPKDNRMYFAITVKVLDSLTREPIRRSLVSFVQNNTLVGEFYTDKEGIVHRELPMGFYYIAAQEPTYQDNYSEGYLNFQRNYVEILLKRPEGIEDPIYVEEVPEEIVIVEEPPVDDPEIPVVIVEIPEVVEEVPVEIDNTPLNELPDTLFDFEHFKYNNITFILDVSSSMNSSGKLDLLKLSMTELVKILRPEDLISVIKYSSSVSVVVDGLSGQDKEVILDRVAELKTSSSTAGGDAIKMAYEMNNRVYAAERNNIVIMITDGAFNKGSMSYLETIAKNYQEKGIIFSVVGIHTSTYITEHMQEVVNAGGGSFIVVRNTEDAQTKIIAEIKRTSFRGRR
jgi:Ca-activated chloride channel family protein